MPPLRTLLPAETDTGCTTPNLTVERQKRKVIRVACESCRKLKSRVSFPRLAEPLAYAGDFLEQCDGSKPSCGICEKRGQQCVYHDRSDAQDQMLRALGLRYKAIDLEASTLRQLLHELATRPLSEATEIFRRIRLNESPQALLEFIKDADIVIQPIMEAAVESQSSPFVCGILQSASMKYTSECLPRPPIVTSKTKPRADSTSKWLAPS